jgi:hypothetical protein
VLGAAGHSKVPCEIPRPCEPQSSLVSRAHRLGLRVLLERARPGPTKACNSRDATKAQSLESKLPALTVHEAAQCPQSTQEQNSFGMLSLADTRL